MGDVWKHLFLGNAELKKSDVDRIHAAIEIDDPSEWSIEDGSVSEYESLSGDFRELEKTLMELGIPYTCQSGDDVEFRYETWWKPGMDEPVTVDLSYHGPAVLFTELATALEAPDPLAAVRELMANRPPEINKPTFTPDALD